MKKYLYSIEVKLIVLLARDAEKKMAGGIYLFKNQASVDGYMKGKIVADIMKNSAVSDIDAKVFDVLPEHSKVIRSPI